MMATFPIDEVSARGVQARAMLNDAHDTKRKVLVYTPGDGLRRHLTIRRDEAGYYVRTGKRGVRVERIARAEPLYPGVNRYVYITMEDTP